MKNFINKMSTEKQYIHLIRYKLIIKLATTNSIIIWKRKLESSQNI